MPRRTQCKHCSKLVKAKGLCEDHQALAPQQEPTPTCQHCGQPAVKNGLCKHHQAAHVPRANKQWKTRASRKWREAFLHNHPYCHDCQVLYGRAVPAVEVHHLRSQAERPDLMKDEDNCLGLCESCHAKRHSAEGRQPAISGG